MNNIKTLRPKPRYARRADPARPVTCKTLAIAFLLAVTLFMVMAFTTGCNKTQGASFCAIGSTVIVVEGRWLVGNQAIAAAMGIKYPTPADRESGGEEIDLDYFFTTEPGQATDAVPPRTTNTARATQTATGFTLPFGNQQVFLGASPIETKPSTPITVSGLPGVTP